MTHLGQGRVGYVSGGINGPFAIKPTDRHFPEYGLKIVKFDVSFWK